MCLIGIGECFYGDVCNMIFVVVMDVDMVKVWDVLIFKVFLDWVEWVGGDWV